jgi:hypothetical protein
MIGAATRVRCDVAGVGWGWGLRREMGAVCELGLRREMGRDITGLRRGWGCEWDQAAAQSKRDDSRGCSCDWAAT